MGGAALAMPSWTAGAFTAIGQESGQAQPAKKAPDARETVSSILQKVSEILLSDTLSREQKRGKVQELIDLSVDFQTVSKLVLAQNWKKFSDAQQTEYVDLFRRHLLNTYWKNADYSAFQGMEITGDRKEARRDWSVMSKVKSRTSDDILIDYRVRQAGEEGDPNGEWKIIDILVEGVSLISNFRSQFQSIVANDGPEKLLQLLRDKVAESERAEAGTGPIKGS
jgi:phospholipid transport system substrate-binding protein